MLPVKKINNLFYTSELFWVGKVMDNFIITKVSPGTIFIGVKYKTITLINKPNFIGGLFLNKVKYKTYKKKVNYELPDRTVWLDQNKKVSNKIKNFLNSIERDYGNFNW